MRNDLGGDFDLRAHGVDGDHGALELPGLGQMVEQVGNGGDLVGFLGHAELGQREAGVGGVGAQRVQRLQALALVVGAARSLAVDGDEVVPTRPEGPNPTLETLPEHQRIHPVHERPQPSPAGDSIVERREPTKKINVMPAPRADVVEIVAGADRRAGQQRQDLRQRIDDPPRLSFVRELGKVLQQQRYPRARNFIVGKEISRVAASGVPKANQGDPGNHTLKSR